VQPGVELDRERLERLGEVRNGLDAPVVIRPRVRIAYDVETLEDEPTVRGRFVRDVLEAGTFADEAERRRVLLTGLRAFDGRDDLEIASEDPDQEPIERPRDPHGEGGGDKATEGPRGDHDESPGESPAERPDPGEVSG
jgi:hypothetical protein